MLLEYQVTEYPVPGALIAAVRHNRPTIMVYGGTIQPGERHLDCPAMVTFFSLAYSILPSKP